MFRLAVALPEHPVDSHLHSRSGGKDVIPPPTGGNGAPSNTPASASANTSVTQPPGDDGIRARASVSQQQRRVGSAVMHRRNVGETSGGGNLISAAAGLGLGQSSAYAHDLASHTPSIGTQYVIDTILDRGGDGDSRPSRITPEPTLYNASLFVLIIYIIVAAVRTSFPSLAFLNCCALVLLDTVHSGLSRGSNEWSPGFKILLLISGRLIIMSSGPALWVVNYSVAYMVYALPLLQALINRYLPHLSTRQAGEMIFANEDHLNKTFPDVAGSEYFCFGLLTLAFISILLVTGLDQQTARLNMLPKDPVPFAGTNWPALTFGVFAILLVVVGGLLMATVRAFHLEFHGLLKGWSRDSFLIKRIINIPRILALAAEVKRVYTFSLPSHTSSHYTYSHRTLSLTTSHTPSLPLFSPPSHHLPSLPPLSSLVTPLVIPCTGWTALHWTTYLRHHYLQRVAHPLHLSSSYRCLSGTCISSMETSRLCVGHLATARCH